MQYVYITAMKYRRVKRSDHYVVSFLSQQLMKTAEPTLALSGDLHFSLTSGGKLVGNTCVGVWTDV